MKYINITLAYSSEQELWLKNFKIEVGTSCGQFLQNVQQIADFPIEINADLALGVFSKRVDNSYILQDGDRLEIYRPLLLTPAQARQLRAEVQVKKAKLEAKS